MSDEWVETTLGEIARITGGGTPSTKQPEFWGGDVVWLTPTEVVAADGQVVSNSVRKITTEGLERSSAKLLPQGTVLLTSRASVGFVAIAGQELATNQGFQSLVPTDAVLPGFLMCWIQANRDEFTRRASGSTFPEVSGKKVATIPITLPPLAVQRRIVDLMTHLDNHLANLRAEREAAECALSVIRESEWAAYRDKSRTLKQVVRGITAGRSPNTSGDRPTADQPGVLKVNSVDPTGRFLQEEAKQLEVGHGMSAEWELKGGEVLITRANTAERVGAVALVPSDVRAGLYLCDKTLRFDFIDGLVDPSFVSEMLLAKSTRNQIASMATGVGSSMVNLSQSKILSLEIPVPAISAQKATAASLAAVRTVVTDHQLEIDAYTRLRAVALAALLSRAVVIPDSYDSLLSEVA